MFMASNLVIKLRSMIRDYISKGLFRLEYISTGMNMTKGGQDQAHAVHENATARSIADEIPKPTDFAIQGS